jgi:hypothetical protein
LTTEDQVRRALDVDVPSDSDDDRFGVSDDSDEDPDYPAGPSTVHEESSDDDDDELPDVDNEPLPVPLLPAQGARQHHKRVASDPAAGERPAKKARAEWTWTPADLPNRASPEHQFTVKGIFFLFSNKIGQIICEWQNFYKLLNKLHDNVIIHCSKILLVRIQQYVKMLFSMSQCTVLHMYVQYHVCVHV